MPDVTHKTREFEHRAPHLLGYMATHLSSRVPQRRALWRCSLLITLGAFITTVSSYTAYAQVSVVGASTSTSSTTSGARKSFFDTTSNLHWAFWYTGSAIEYASSPDAATWTSQGTLPYNTANFSVAFKAISGTSYVFLVSEANTYDVVMRRGSISGTSITFDGEVTVLDGTSASDKYITPTVALDANNKVWAAAFKDLGDVGDRYLLTTRRTINSGSSTLGFGSTYSIGKPAISVTNVAIVPTSSDKMLAAVSGESGRNVVAYEFNGTSWNIAGSLGEYGAIDFAQTGFLGRVNAIAVDSTGNLYAGGSFTRFGQNPINRIAKWNGTSWSGLGAGMDDQVLALATDSGGNVYAGGDFTTADGVTVNYIAKWNGTSWSSLGDGMNQGVSALALDASENLYAGGYFTTAGGAAVNRIAKWNGNSWSSLGTGMNALVRSLAIDPSGNVYAAGMFTNAGGVTANYISKWDGSSWSGFGTGTDGAVISIALDASGNLYAGGSFTTAGGGTVNRIARWNGTSWSSLGTGLDGSVEKLATDSSGTLYVTGYFTTAGGVAVNYLATWNGIAWSAPEASPEMPATSLTVDSSDNIYLGEGGFGHYAGVFKWNGTSLVMMGRGIKGSVNYAAVDSTNNLYAAGFIERVDGVTVKNIAKWNGTSWSSLGTGIEPNVYALTVDPGGGLYAAGDFTNAGGIAVNHIAKWNGTSWSALDAGLNNTVMALTVGPDGTVYAGGGFTGAGSTPVNRVAQWNGTSWSNLGPGVDGEVFALATDSHGNLYAGGRFANAGGVPANYIAKWNGSAWSSLGTGMNGDVWALTTDSSGNLYAGGSFTTAGSATVNYIAKWNGTSWSSLGADVDADVYALAVDSAGSLYAGGDFTTSVAKWNGISWTSLGAGSGAYSIALDSQGNLYSAANNLSYLHPLPASNQLPNTTASLVPGSNGNAHLFYIDSNNDVQMKTYSGASSSWSSATTVRTGTVTSQSAGFYGNNSDIAAWFIDGGVVKYSESSSPYSSWTSPTTVSSTGSPREISVVSHTGSHSQMLATWNRTGSSPGEVAAATSGAAPTPTPAITPTFTATSTPIATPTISTPPPPDIELGQPGDTSQGRAVIVGETRATLSGTGPVGYLVEIRVDDIVVGTVPITSANGSATGTWSFTLPPLAPGNRVITTTFIDPNGNRSTASDPINIQVLAAAPLDFTGTGDTAITSWRKSKDGIRFKTRRASSAEWTTETIQGRYPAAADYDDDGVSDFAAVGLRKGALEWNIKLSTTGASATSSLGDAGDTLISGCTFTANKGASLAVFKSEQRTLQFKNLGDATARTVQLKNLGSCNVIGCGDTDGDGVDELLFSTRASDNRARVVGYDTTGQRKFESKYNQFVRGFVVDRPNSPVPLVAILGGTQGQGRQVRITTMAGSFAFPRFFVDRDATIGTGTFTNETNQQFPGIFWATHSSRDVYRRLLSQGAETTKLFTLPKGYSLLRSQQIVRTGGKR